MSDSTIHARFTVTTKIAKAIDNESSRYALANALLQPARRGGVFLTATDGKQLSVSHYEGETDARYLVPGPALPTANGGGRIELNGNWQTTTGKRATKTTLTPRHDITQARFPRADDVLATVDETTHDVVTIDPRLLLKLYESVEADGELLTLFVPKDRDNGFNGSKDAIEKPIAALGGSGFGVIMPGNVGSAKNVADKMELHNDFVREYKATFGQATESELPLDTE